MTLSRSAIVSSLRGAFVADAASMGTHWIYNPKDMAKAVPSVDAPEFKNPPTPSYYSAEEFPGHYGPGMLSPYGEQLLFVTEHLAEAGAVDGETMSQNMFEWADSKYTGRKDAALKKFIENRKEGKVFPECGADDSEAHCFIKAVPVTCLYAGKPELKAKVEEAIRVHQNNDKAVAYGITAALILEKVLLEKAIPDDSFVQSVSEDQVKESWTKASAYTDMETLMLDISHEKMAGKEDSPLYDVAGRSCALPGSFVGSAFLLQNAAGDDQYATAVRANILASGDTCGRSVFFGSVIATTTGGPPDDWVAKMDPATLKRIDAAANKIADLVGAE